MSAAKIIEQINALPPKDRMEVFAFVHELESKASSSTEVRMMDNDTFENAAKTIFEKHGDLLKKLAK